MLPLGSLDGTKCFPDGARGFERDIGDLTVIRLAESQPVMLDLGLDVLPSGQHFLPVPQIGALDVDLADFRADFSGPFVQPFDFHPQMHLHRDRDEDHHDQTADFSGESGQLDPAALLLFPAGPLLAQVSGVSVHLLPLPPLFYFVLSCF